MWLLWVYFRIKRKFEKTCLCGSSSYPRMREEKKKSMYFSMMYILSVAKWANSNCFENFMWQTQHSKHQGWCPKAGRPVEWWALIGISDLDKLLEIAAHMWTLRRDSYSVTAGGPVKIMAQCSHFLQHHEQQFWKVCLLGAGLKFQLDAHHSAGCQLLGIYFGAMNGVFAPWIFQDNLNWLTPDCARARGIFDPKKEKNYIFSYHRK